LELQYGGNQNNHVNGKIKIKKKISNKKDVVKKYQNVMVQYVS